MKEPLEIFKTLRTDDIIPMRGLSEMAAIMQTAYDLFGDAYFIQETGDPFLKFAKNQSLYQNFNRATIENTINQSGVYGEIRFSGAFLSVSSKGIEEYLKDLEVIWLSIQGMKADSNQIPDAFEVETRLLKWNFMGRLATMIYYFMHTCQNLITTIRVRQLSEKLLEIPEIDRKAILLRYKTDLLKNKHGIKAVHEELLRVIELELDLIKELESSSTPKAYPEITIPNKHKSPLPVSIDTDFEYELSIFDFPYKKTLQNDVLSSEHLKYEFSNLPAEPKRHWYFNDFINGTDWGNHCASEFTPKDASAIYINTEQMANQLFRDFSRKLLDHTVDTKYYGRHLRDTLMVRTLNEIDQKLADLNGYVVLDSKIDNYSTYAKVAAKSIVESISKLPGSHLRLIILEEIINQSLDSDFGLRLKLFGLEQRDAEHAQIGFRFKILKLHANDYFKIAKKSLIKTANADVLIEVENKTAKTPPVNIKSQASVSLFRDQSLSDKFLSLLKTSMPPVLDQTGHYILGERKKSAITAWYDVLLKKGKLSTELSWQEKTEQINRLIPGLDVSMKTLTSSVGSTYRKYYQIFMDQLSQH